MSGIYGFTYRCADPQTSEDALGGLAYWNWIFGREAHGNECMGNSAIGCRIEHFSARFPYGGPILRFRSQPAVVDALLYNRDELTAFLGLPEPCALSDEELLLKLVDEKGFDALARVNGDFAGAIYNDAGKEWTLFRDHFGVRPLYLYRDDNCFAFSTDLRGLAALPGADLRIDEDQFYTRLSGGNYLSLQKTDFQHICCALPAAVTKIRLTETGFSLTEHVYWRIRQRRIHFRSDAQYQQELCRLITDSVNRRCDAIDGILGAELSGGLDSGVIDILINRHGREGRYYSWSRDPEEFPLRDGTDERKVVLDICSQEHISCRFRNAQDAVDFRRTADRMMPPFVNTLRISYGSAWMKSEGANVVFTGHAGDEGVSHRASRFELFYNREYLAYFKLYWQDARGKRLRLLRALRWAVRDAISRTKELAVDGGFHPTYSPILLPEFCSRMLKQHTELPLYFNYAPHKYVMQGGTRPRMENAAYQGAVNGVRYLFPYVDHRVFDYSLSIPRRLYLDHKRDRLIFREAFREIMPASLYEINYKDSASLRDLRKKSETIEKKSESQQKSMERILSALDESYWSEILDFDLMRSLAAGDDTAGIGGMFISELNRCLSIQNIRDNSCKWREFDERDKETV